MTDYAKLAGELERWGNHPTYLKPKTLLLDAARAIRELEARVEVLGAEKESEKRLADESVRFQSTRIESLATERAQLRARVAELEALRALAAEHGITRKGHTLEQVFRNALDCWQGASDDVERLESERDQLRAWVAGLDRLNAEVADSRDKWRKRAIDGLQDNADLRAALGKLIGSRLPDAPRDIWKRGWWRVSYEAIACVHNDCTPVSLTLGEPVFFTGADGEALCAKHAPIHIDRGHTALCPSLRDIFPGTCTCGHAEAAALLEKTK